MGLFRVLLAVSVLLAHCNHPHWLRGFGAENSVEIFFVISGFYIATILDKGYSKIKYFYINRALRLYPIYFMVALLVIIRALLIHSFWVDLFHYPAQILFVGSLANLALFGSDWIMFLQWHHSALHFGPYTNSEFPIFKTLFAPQAWSLGVEVSFYLLAPSLCKLKSRNLLAVGLILTVARGVAWIYGLNLDPWTYRFFPFELPLFIAGIFLYRAKKRLIRKNVFHPNSLSLNLLMLIIFFGLGLLLMATNVDRKIQFALMFLLASAVILNRNQGKIDYRMGQVSFPLYISHVFVISSIEWISNRYAGTSLFKAIENFSPWSLFCIEILLSFAFAVFLLYLNSPIEKLRSRIRATGSEIKSSN